MMMMMMKLGSILSNPSQILKTSNKSPLTLCVSCVVRLRILRRSSYDSFLKFEIILITLRCTPSIKSISY